MKAPVRATQRLPQQMKKRSRAHSTLIYRTYKVDGLAGMRSSDFLAGRLAFPRPVLLRLVSSEASRLSKTNRLRVVTLQELNAAVTLVQERIYRRAAA